MFQMPGMTGAANSAMSGIGQVGQFQPQAQQTAQNLYNNPFAGQGLGGAQAASGLGQNAAYAGFNTGASMVPYAQQIFQSGMDPQQQLYQRTLQQVQDQSNVNNSMAGVGTTPYGAGLTNQATRDFNIDWQNQQLQREALAGQAGGQLAGQGVNMMNQAPGQLVQSAMLPYATYSDIGQGQNQAIGQYQGLANLPVQDLFQYLGVGNQAGQVANQNFSNQLSQANQAWNQQGQFAQGVGSLLGGANDFLGAIPFLA